MSDLRECISVMIFKSGDIADTSADALSEEIIALVRADYEQKVIEAVQSVLMCESDGMKVLTEYKWNIIEAIKQVLAETAIPDDN